MSTAIAKLDAEIAALQAEATRVEAMPPTVAERFEKVEAELLEAERVYRERGLNPSGVHPGETEHLRRLALIGCSMVAAGDKLLKAEHQRIAAQGEGMSAPDKAAKLAEIRRRVLRASAQRELLVREQPDDFMIARPWHAEMAIWRRADLEQLLAR